MRLSLALLLAVVCSFCTFFAGAKVGIRVGTEREAIHQLTVINKYMQSLADRIPDCAEYDPPGDLPAQSKPL